MTNASPLITDTADKVQNLHETALVVPPLATTLRHRCDDVVSIRGRMLSITLGPASIRHPASVTLAFLATLALGAVAFLSTIGDDTATITLGPLDAITFPLADF
eukprot:s2223_g10.t1